MYKIINFDIKGDDRGSLISIEQKKNLPFDIKRVYYIFKSSGNVRRGMHAHKKLKQLLVAVNGSCKLVIENGIFKECLLLDSPSKGIYIEEIVWREIYDFSDDCVLMVLTDDYYNEDDYIRNYEEFKRYVNAKK